MALVMISETLSVMILRIKHKEWYFTFNPKIKESFGKKLKEISFDTDVSKTKRVVKNQDNHVRLYTDGSCLGKSKIKSGGWAAIIIGYKTYKEYSQSFKYTTNNRMEIMAILCGLQSIPKHKDITVYSDSKYGLNGCSKWIHNWKNNDWKKADGSDISNLDIWMKLYDVIGDHRGRIEWKWVKGHSGDVMNESVDKLALNAAKKQTGFKERIVK